jgi:hypothetical protein
MANWPQVFKSSWLLGVRHRQQHSVHACRSSSKYFRHRVPQIISFPWNNTNKYLQIFLVPESGSLHSSRDEYTQHFLNRRRHHHVQYLYQQIPHSCPGRGLKVASPHLESRINLILTRNRIMPPVASGQPRIIPPEGAQVAGHFIPGG